MIFHSHIRRDKKKKINGHFSDKDYRSVLIHTILCGGYYYLYNSDEEMIPWEVT